ncbi:alginate lyase family protein [candidate division KSB1 bacterium]|nr:alginate lyase family protein [candidate division KSB1 bacterium]
MQFLVRENRRLNLTETERPRILTAAEKFLSTPTVHIPDDVALMSEGGPHDYYSNGDYWWRNPDTQDGLPYIRRDGESNPMAFHQHRRTLRAMRTAVATLAAAYDLTQNEVYSAKAVRFLKEFFLDAETRMNPHLRYAQALPGICSGRGIGIIDTLHLVEVPVAIDALRQSPTLTPDILAGLKAWFADYLEWMTTHPYGIDEMNEVNNHGVAWTLQVALFAMLTGNREKISFCRQRYKEVLLPEQMAQDGGFTAELARTKPYGYSIFQLDNVATLCHVLSTPEENLWEFELADGRGVRKGIEFLFPYLEDKSKWCYPPDVQHFEAWPVRQSALLFAGLAYNEEKYLQLWKKLDPDPVDPEVRRNMATRQPLLWV